MNGPDFLSLWKPLRFIALFTLALCLAHCQTPQKRYKPSEDLVLTPFSSHKKAKETLKSAPGALPSPLLSLEQNSDRVMRR